MKLSLALSWSGQLLSRLKALLIHIRERNRVIAAPDAHARQKNHVPLDF